jgi:CarD family transcriptional regulator
VSTVTATQNVEAGGRVQSRGREGDEIFTRKSRCCWSVLSGPPDALRSCTTRPRRRGSLTIVGSSDNMSRLIRTSSGGQLEMTGMFKVGEKVVYPAHGVGVIEGIQTRVVSGSERKFYMLRILDSDMTIMIPTENVNAVGLRRIIGKDMVAKVYRILRDKKVEIDQQTWNRRYREYTEKIKTGSVLEIAKVLRDLFVLKGDKELSFGERKMLDTARNLLVKELAIAKSFSEEKIMEELRTIFAN